MSIQVYSGFSGHRYSLDPGVTSTLEALRSWIAQHASIQPRNQILLTAQGKQVRTQTLLTENELFVFDSSRLSKTGSVPTSSEGIESVDSNFIAGDAPDVLTDQHDIQSWQDLFQSRKSWAIKILEGCNSQAIRAETLQQQQTIIERSLGVAVASLQQHLKVAHQKYGNIEAWAGDVVGDHENIINNWEEHLSSLRNVPARVEFARFLRPPSMSSRRPSQQANMTTLQNFVDIPGTRKAASAAKSLSSGLSGRVVQMHDTLDAIAKSSTELTAVADELTQRSISNTSSEAAQLLDEIKVVVRKMNMDSETVHNLHGPQAISQVSKMALLHTRNYLPSLGDFCLEMNELVHKVQQQKNDAAQSVLEHMRILSGIEAQLSDLFHEFKELDMPQDDQQAFATLSAIARLPAVYGQLLVESVRRREWVAKMRRDCATLQEEVAMHHEEEDKRRKKWVRTVDDVVDPELLHSSALGIELSLQNEGGSWPMVTREELQEYLDVLNTTYGQGPMSEQMEQAVKDLDKPTRKQVRHAKAFKNGSMYDAAFGDTSLFIRGDEQHKTLREANARLEEDIKGQRSRVRKLEDLLHRQTQTNRSGTGDLFTPHSFSFDRGSSSAAQTPISTDDSGRTSMQRNRRQSLTQVSEEKRLARRVVDLETQIQTLRSEAASRKSSDAETQKQVEEAVSTKKDLLDNMDAQQREFAIERRALEQELTEAREKLEEAENELERLMDNRDGEKANLDGKLVALEEEIARLKDDATGHAARAATEYDTRVAMEDKLTQATSAKVQSEAGFRNLKREHEQLREAEANSIRALNTIHSYLVPDADAPQDVASLAAALEEAIRRSRSQNKELLDSLNLLRSGNESLTTSNERHKTELAGLSTKQIDLERQLRIREDKLAAEQAKTTNLQQQLEDEQDQLKVMRDKFAEGETGSEFLKHRLIEAESRAIRLSTELAETKSHANAMDVELMRLQRNQEGGMASIRVSSERLAMRAERAKEVTQRLFAQVSRLKRLLERLGFVVQYTDEAMIIERASKMNSSTNMTESQPIHRANTFPSLSPTRQPLITEAPPNFASLRWPDASTSEEEQTQYEDFLRQISRFNLDSFCDAIVKRVRDFEYTARKYSKEAKEATKRADGYKERSSKLHREAHAKLAVRDFKEGDLALFLPTRGQAKGAWAAFNIGCPHYFLAEKEGMRLSSRDFIVGRITRIEQRIVNMSKSVEANADNRSLDGVSEAPSTYDDNPFDLSDGLTWWMVYANEERGIGAAPSTPGLGKSTVASAIVDAKGSIRIKRGSKSDDASKHLNKSLESRRSSSASKRSVAGAMIPALAHGNVGITHSPTSGGLLDTSSLGQHRSTDQNSHRPSPVTASGLGIMSLSPGDAGPLQQSTTAELSGAANQNEQDMKHLHAMAMAEPMSKSVRSLQQHLEPSSRISRSPNKSPARSIRSNDANTRTGGGAPAWERLGEYAIESSAKSNR